jgi:Fe2+ or Zn2+ uptake regulation protein
MTSGDIRDILWRKYSMEILSSASDPMTATEISNDVGVPMATCYRRLNELVEIGLLEKSDSASIGDLKSSEKPSGSTLYQRSINSVNIDFDGGVSISKEDRSKLKFKHK